MTEDGKPVRHRSRSSGARGERDRRQGQRTENRVSDLLTRLADMEKVNLRLRGSCATTARALAEISGHWDAVYEAMQGRVEERDAPRRSEQQDVTDVEPRSIAGLRPRGS
jgi:hypothetical protein